MRLHRVKEVKPGMINGISIYDLNNKLLLSHGYQINKEVLEKLIERGYNYIYIMEEGTEDVIPDEIVSYSVRLQAFKILESIVENLKKLSEFKGIDIDTAIELIEDGYIQSENITFDVRKIVEEMLNDIAYARPKILKTIFPKSTSTYFIDHAINTTILSILFGYKYRFNSKDLMNLGIGAFLHDIGKIIVEQLKGIGDLRTAKKLYQEHPTVGYNMLRNSSIISSIQNQIVYQHHENQDGTGFPKALRGSNLPPRTSTSMQGKGKIFRLAEICSVANTYDKMVLNPYYKEQFSPRDVIKKLITMSGTTYNKDVVRSLIQVVPIYPVGVYLRVTEIDDSSLMGYYGVVEAINEDNLSKPIIVLIVDKQMKHIKPIKVNTAQFDKVKLELIV